MACRISVVGDHCFIGCQAGSVCQCANAPAELVTTPTTLVAAVLHAHILSPLPLFLLSHLPPLWCPRSWRQRAMIKMIFQNICHGTHGVAEKPR